MAAPSGIIWGGIVNSGTSKAAKIGIYRTVSNKSNTLASVKVEVWLWTRYAVSDSYNTVYFDWDKTTATSSVKTDVPVSTTNSEWSTSNQVLLWSSNARDYNRRDGALTGYCAAKMSGLEQIGSDISMYTSFTIPALPYYTITYNANGGTGAPDAHGYYYGNNTSLSTTKPTRPGYTFLGWNTDKNATAAAYSSGQSWSGTNAGNYTLYAIWAINKYTITYNANGGTNAPASQTVNHGSSVALAGSSTSPTRPNYELVGWATTNDAATAEYLAGSSFKPTGNITLYAVWKLAYTVPSITDLRVYRCDSNGNPDDYGTYFKVSFGWATSQLLGTNNIKSVKIEWKAHSDSSYSSSNSTSPSASGISGTVATDKLGGGAISTDKVYDIRITVTDNTTQTPNYAQVTYPLPNSKFLIDFKNGGNGVSIGKPAVLDDTFEVDLVSKFNKNMLDRFGSVINNGLAQYTGSGNSAIDPDTTLDMLILSNKNTPISGIFFYIETFFYSSKSTASNRTQTATPYNKVGSTYHRYYYDGAWSSWYRNVEENDTVVLYDNSTGTCGNVSLIEDVSNFKMIEIIAGWTDVHGQSVKVYSPNGKVVDISLLVPGTSGGTFGRTRCTISGTSITQQYNQKTTASGVTWSQTSDAVYIKTVIGYR